MNKFLKVLACTLLGGTMVFAAACGGGNGGGGEGGTHVQTYNPESRALALSIGALDGNFNPFYATSLTDTQVISMTQSSLITSKGENDNVEPVAGEEYNTVAKDFEIKYYNAREGGQEVTNSSEAANGGRTEYRFLIKNGMKFSDGEPLTIKDVLFNFYVYLDPVYTGSNTMYSVDIQGLKAYQNNNSQLADDETEGSNTYVTNAQNRLRALIGYGAGEDGYETLNTQGEADYERVKVLFREELTTDWNNMETSWVETYKVNYTFNEAWQAYLFQEGIITTQKRKYSDGTVIEIRVDPSTGEEINPKTDKAAYALGKIKTTLDPWVVGATEAGNDEGKIGRQDIIDDIAAAASENLINEYKAEHNCDDDMARLQLTKEYCIDRVYRANLEDKRGLDEVLSYWATGTNAYNEFLADERGKTINDSKTPQYYIKGIQTEKVTTFKGIDLKDTYDVLKIIINDVDPAAIWQFGITIAPMHYYSGTYGGKNYVTSFNGDQNNGKGTNDENACFGVKRGDFNFFTDVVKGVTESKSALPVGAGPYMASTSAGGTTTDGGKFYENYIVYYQRNPNFETMGTGLCNAKIKYLRYKVVSEDSILSSITTGNIDYGEPNATDTNNTAVTQQLDRLERITYDTNGFGYVGINPTFVPDVRIRRIIMRAMDPALSIGYYGSLARTLNRPMSRTSWAYPEDSQPYYTPFGENSTQEIKNLLASYKYHDSGNGVYTDGKNTLKYTFTIAGANSDHPAYNMFEDAARTLNAAGFDITVSTDPNALLKLASGGLAVWAAAWSSGVDPDMYQVYHKDSQATSVLNWGYRTIYNDVSGIYSFERPKIDTLSGLIEDARETTLQSERAATYSTCLDLIMELAIELPIYQRKDMCVFNKTIIDSTTVNGNANSYNGVLDRIWEVNYK